MGARRREVRAERYESSSCSTELHVDDDRARDLDLRGPGDAPRITAERDESALSYTHEQRADEDEDDDEPPNNADADEAGGCGLVPVTCCGV